MSLIFDIRELVEVYKTILILTLYLSSYNSIDLQSFFAKVVPV
jgi:hypothetical protein